MVSGPHKLCYVFYFEKTKLSMPEELLSSRESILRGHCFPLKELLILSRHNIKKEFTIVKSG